MTWIKNKVVAQSVSPYCWTVAGTDEGSADYLLYAMDHADNDWWEIILVQLGSEMGRDFFTFEAEVFRTVMFAKVGYGIKQTLQNMVETLVDDEVDITNPVDFVDSLGGESTQGGMRDALWH